jgi:hypothetical protein
VELVPRRAHAFTEREPSLSDFERFESERPVGAHFDYASAEEWAGQLLERPQRPTLVETSEGAALVETQADFDRVQAIAAKQDDRRSRVLAGCLSRAHARGKRLFLFESQPSRAERWVSELGLEAAKGFLTALQPADPSPVNTSLALAGWSLDSGDRM